MKWRLDSGQIEVVDEALAEVLRRKTIAEKVQMIAAAHRTARQLVRAGVRHQHPKWTDARVEAEVLRRLTRGAVRREFRPATLPSWKSGKRF